MDTPWIPALIATIALVLAGEPAVRASEIQGATAPVAKPLPAKVTAIGAALSASGRLWLARPEGNHLHVSYSDDHGRSFSEGVRVNGQPEVIAAAGENRPKIAIGPDDSIHVSWVRNLAKRFSGEVRYSRSVDGGMTFSTPVTINQDRTETSHRFDSLVVDADGRVVIGWLDQRDRDSAKARGVPFAGDSFYVAVSSDAGASFAPNRRIAEHTCECCRTGMAATRSGTYALWRHIFGKNTRDFALMRIDADARLERATDDEWAIDACPHQGGTLAADGRDNLHLTWSTGGARRQGAFHRRLSGGAESAIMPLGAPGRQVSHPAVAARGAAVVIAWQEYDGRQFALWSMYSRDHGDTWSSPARLATAAGASDYPLPLAGNAGGLVLWNGAGEGLRVFTVGENAQ